MTKETSMTSARPLPELEDLLKAFTSSAPEIVFEWCDQKTKAKGYLVINSLRGGAAGGGTRLRAGLNKEEMISLAKTMEIKFTVTGPAIGGAKSGIDFDPLDPRKEEVLKRWFSAIRPLLKNYYGTGGDLNVDEVKEVIPITQHYKIDHPQEGIVIGHFEDTSHHASQIQRLQRGVSQIVSDTNYTPQPEVYKVADLITGYGVSETLRHYYRLWNTEIKEKRAIIQGWGNVAAAAAFYLAAAGVRIVGIIDRAGGILKKEGLSFAEIKQLFLNRKGNTLHATDLLSFKETESKIWDIGAEIFVPAAASRIVTQEQCARMMNQGLEVIASGANVPFAEQEIFYGPTTQYVDDRIALLPDFITSSAMARVFAYLMSEASPNQIETKDIFSDCSSCIARALEQIRKHTTDTKYLSRIALYQALRKLL